MKVRAGHVLTATAVLVATMFSGCIERSFEIRSDPPGALVVVDGVEMGITPIAQEFVHYGTRNIILSKQGFQRKTVAQKMEPPWYEYFPIDFFVEIVWPFPVRDSRIYAYLLEPATEVDKKGVLKRADDLEKRMRELGAHE